MADATPLTTPSPELSISLLSMTTVVVSKLSVKKDPSEIQHPKLENSRLGFIESVYER